MTAEAPDRPALARGCRLRWEPARETYLLLFPEGAVTLNATAHAVLELCDGQRTVPQIAAELAERFPATHQHELEGDVRELLDGIVARGLVVDAGA